MFQTHFCPNEQHLNWGHSIVSHLPVVFPEDGGGYLRAVDGAGEVEDRPDVDVETAVVCRVVQEYLGVGLWEERLDFSQVLIFRVVSDLGVRRDLLLNLLSTRLNPQCYFPIVASGSLARVSRYWYLISSRSVGCRALSFIPKREWNFLNEFRIPEHCIRLLQRKEEI